MADRLKQHREIWKEKKLLRDIYTGWYKQILKDLNPGKGTTIELGAGSGNFKEFKPGVVAADIEPCQWLDMCFDAHEMPFKTGSTRNIVMIDVLHHLADPVGFLREAARSLEKGGRIVLLEPFPSPFSLFIYKRFHPEPFIMTVDYFDKRSPGSAGPAARGPSEGPSDHLVSRLIAAHNSPDSSNRSHHSSFNIQHCKSHPLVAEGIKSTVLGDAAPSVSSVAKKKDPWEANQAAAYLLFFKNKKQFLQQFEGEFKIIKRKRMSCILYPASGGFENKALIPEMLIPCFKFLEILSVPLRRLLAFRCYIVLERV